MPTYLTLQRFPSSSSSATYHVATEGAQVSCDCPGWTNQTHYGDCPAVVQGAKCSCRARVREGVKTARTCRHLRETLANVSRVGGLRAAIALVNNGLSLDVDYSRSESPAVLARLAAARRDAGLAILAAGARESQLIAERIVADVPVSWPRSTPRRPRRSSPTPTSPTPTLPRGGRAIRVREEEDE